MVKCKICKKKLTFISKLHLKHHNLTRDSYIEIFPNAKLCNDNHGFKKGNKPWNLVKEKTIIYIIKDLWFLDYQKKEL